MHADGMVLAADSTAALEPSLARLRQRQRDRVFSLGLLVAFAAHALAIAAMIGFPQSHRSVGSPDGAADAIAVEIVDGATLKDSMEPPTPPTPPPGQAPQQTAAVPPSPPQPQAQPAPPEPPAPEETQVEAPPEPPPPDPPKAEAVPEAAPPESKAEPSEKDASALAAEAIAALEEAPVAEQQKEAAQPPKAEPPPEKKQEPVKKEAAKKPVKQQKAAPKKRQLSALDLSVPFDGSSAEDAGGSSSAVQRPPGITKSGENDEFARNVIRALQRSMPRENARGRVTVRIVLNPNGSRADVTLLKSGGDSDLDFNVMFAARQTAYPFPPKGATVADRTFMVTYIYR